MKNNSIRSVLGIIMFLQPLFLSGQLIQQQVQFPDCSEIEEINFDIEELISNKNRFRYLSVKDTLEKLYCIAKQTNNTELEAISLYKLGLQFQEEYGNLYSFRQMIGYLEKSMEISKKHDYHQHLLAAKEILCSSFTSNKVYGQALFYAQEFIEIAQAIQDSVKTAEGYMLLGRIMREQESYIKSDSIFHQSLNYITESSESSRIAAYTYMHLSNLKRLEKKYTESIEYGKIGLRFAEKLNNHSHQGFLKAILAIEIILSNIEIGEFNNNQILDLIEKYAMEDKSSWMNGQFHFIKGVLFEKSGNNRDAISEYNIAVEHSYKAGTRLHTLKVIEKLMPLLLSQRGNEELINRIYYISHKTLNEVLKHNGSDNLFKMTYYRLENELTKSKYLQSTLDDYNKVLAFSFSIIALLFFIGILLYRQNRFRKRNNSTLNKLNTKLSRNNNKLNESNRIIAKKKNELELELKHQLILISSFGEQINKLKNTFKNNNELDFKFKREILGMLDFEKNKNIIEDINFKFLEINKSLISLLSSKYPKLTNNDLKLCLYLKMNLSTKEIAHLQYKSIDAIKVARSRLRKKMNTSDSNTLTTFLNSIENLDLGANN